MFAQGLREGGFIKTGGSAELAINSLRPKLSSQSHNGADSNNRRRLPYLHSLPFDDIIKLYSYALESSLGRPPSVLVFVTDFAKASASRARVYSC